MSSQFIVAITALTWLTITLQAVGSDSLSHNEVC